MPAVHPRSKWRGTCSQSSLLPACADSLERPLELPCRARGHEPSQAQRDGAWLVPTGNGPCEGSVGQPRRALPPSFLSDPTAAALGPTTIT